jgi:hypothetical protein
MAVCAANLSPSKLARTASAVKARPNVLSLRLCTKRLQTVCAGARAVGLILAEIGRPDCRFGGREGRAGRGGRSPVTPRRLLLA